MTMQPYYYLGHSMHCVNIGQTHNHSAILGETPGIICAYHSPTHFLQPLYEQDTAICVIHTHNRTCAETWLLTHTNMPTYQNEYSMIRYPTGLGKTITPNMMHIMNDYYTIFKQYNNLNKLTLHFDFNLIKKHLLIRS